MIKTDFNSTNPYKFFRYGRMSLEQQNPRSPDQQFDMIAERVSRLRFPWSGIGDYRDDGITGKFVKRRPGFSRMLADIRSGRKRPDLILLDTSERLGRSEELADIRRELRVRYGVLILTADSNFADPTTPAGRVMESFELVRAWEENRIKGHQVRRGKVDAIREGHWPGGKPSFGYKLQTHFVERHGRQDVDHCTLIRNPEEDWILQRAFQQARITGYGPTKLARLLNADEGIPAKFKPFKSSTIATWLDNAIYIGTLVWGANATDIIEDVRILRPSPEDDVIVKHDFCEPLIDPETWDAVQGIRKPRRERSLRARQRNKCDSDDKLIRPMVPGIALKYPLSGLVVCGVCGRAMTISTTQAFTTKSGEKRTYPSYFCSASNAGACSNRRRVSEEWLFEQVLCEVNKLFL